MARTEKSNSEQENVDFHGGTIIGKDGHEVAITEEMVREAIRKLDPDALPGSEDNSH